MMRTPSNRVGSLISRRWPSPRTAVWRYSRTLPGHGRCAPPSDGGRPHPSAPSVPLTARAWSASGPLGSYLGAKREHTPGTGSSARSRARSWGATGKARAPSARSPCHAPRPDIRSVDTTDPHQRSSKPTPRGLAKWAGPSPPAQAIQARERTQIKAAEDSKGHVEVFQMDGVGISIIERPRPLHNHDTPNATHNTYTPNYEEPVKPRLYCTVWATRSV